ncbi:MAG TPA: LLM class flavin-dependent oxidoreductase [Candidatus Limnocylindrales bacterium]|nr:LLM class flavin-dependent oxidoreductase [Candidatus Limnocylindrales bacterium]
MPAKPIRLGANCWNQYTDWPAFLDAQRRADSLGFDSIWTWDHLYPIIGSHEGPILEGYLAMAAVAQVTQRATVGLMVGANTFRNPALTAKMVTTLDHISGGRAVLGIGGAWFETEHEAYGIEFGESPGERLRWLGDALPIMRGMLHGEEPSAEGPRYRAKALRNDPPPLQKHLPILIGGSGPKVTLRLVAQYGDACNLGGSADSVRDKDAILRQHCEEVGRDEREIERTVGAGTVVIRDSRAEAERVQRAIFERNGRAEVWKDQPVGTPEDVAEHFGPYIELGFRHLICGFPSPYDEESMTRLANEVRPMLDRDAA